MDVAPPHVFTQSAHQHQQLPAGLILTVLDMARIGLHQQKSGSQAERGKGGGDVGT